LLANAELPKKTTRFVLGKSNESAIVWPVSSKPIPSTSRDDRVDAADNQTLATLYRWYAEGFRRSTADANFVRQTLGYADSNLEPRLLDMADFEKWLTGAWNSSALRQAWLQTVMAGHEAEFESLMAASNNIGERRISSAIDQSNRSAA